MQRPPNKHSFSVKSVTRGLYSSSRDTVLFFSLVFISVFCAGSLVTSSVAEAACKLPTTTYGTDSIPLNLPADGDYTLWVRMQAPSLTSNSLLMQIDGASCYTVGGNAGMPLNNWVWVNYQNGIEANIMHAHLSEGEHTVELIGTEPGVSIDRVEFLTDSDCVPTNSGNNCSLPPTSPPSVTFVSPKANTTLSGVDSPIEVTAAPAKELKNTTIMSVSVKIDDALVATLTDAPFHTSYNSTFLANGSHLITATATDSRGQSSTASETITSANAVIQPAPQITGISPNSGPLAGNTKITITGINFVPGSTVILDSGPATQVTVVNSTTIQANVPAHGAGLVNIAVTSPNGQQAVKAGGFSYVKGTVTGDDNTDGHVNSTDLSILLHHDKKTYPQADFNHDGNIGAPDLSIMLSNWTW